ncbi:MAG: flagellar assembly protein FliW [Pirellulales bacterium]|nr:flagellar assembly protein FliW [Pirellulales bacterium]
MRISTTRFGELAVQSEHLLTFPAGMLGLEDCQQWVLLADTSNDALGWLQSAERAEIAMAVVSPRRFVPDYQVRVTRREIEAIDVQNPNDSQVLVIVGKNGRSVTLNLKAPLLLNMEHQIGRQVIVTNDLPVQYELTPPRRAAA